MTDTRTTTTLGTATAGAFFFETTDEADVFDSSLETFDGEADMSEIKTTDAKSATRDGNDFKVFSQDEDTLFEFSAGTDRAAESPEEGVIFTGNEGPSGTDYAVSHQPDFHGDHHDNTIDGNDLDNDIYGYAGNDTIYAGGGEDKLFGGVGSDILYGGDDDDTLRGNEHDDELYGDAGGDTLDGGDGSDILSGDSGDDFLLGGKGNDVVDGGDGEDFITDNGGNDIYTGGAGADTFMFNRIGPDHYYTSGGEDLIEDFELGVDTLMIGQDDPAFTGLTFNEYIDQYASGGGELGVVLEWEGGLIRLAGIEASDLTPWDISFA